MTDETGRHAASADEPPPRPDAPPTRSDVPPRTPTYARPDGVDGGFAPRQEPRPYQPPPPTVPPADQLQFGRPPGAGAFAPTPGERLAPRPSQHPMVPNVLAQTFAATPDAREGFAPSPGDRVPPTGPPPESPWWKPDAVRDPWRDPTSPFWLGGGAVIAAGRPEQRDPDHDTVSADLDVMSDDEELDERPDNVRTGRFGLPTLLVTLIVALVAGGIGGGAGWLITRQVGDSLHRTDISLPQVETPVTRPPTSVAGIAKRVGPTVVSIAVRTPTEYGIGSGVVIDKDGDVLTNNHVIEAAVGVKGASIIVTFSNEDTARAQIVGRDATSDLAVIKVPNTQLTVAALGDSARIAVGDPVIAIGSPLGLQGTVTAGIISALNRPVHVYSDDGTSDAYLNAIQTDAPINPGNSGGALVNSSGAVIGINSAAALGSTGPSGSTTSASGIGYAIPINYAREIALELIHTGKAVHGSLGAQGKTYLSGVYGGAFIEQISPGGAAAKAGLKTGDVIIAVDGTVVQTFDQLIVIVQGHKPGDSIQVTYYPRGTTQKATATVTLG